MISIPHLGMPVACVQGKMGNRLAIYQTVVSATEIEGLVGHDPSPSNWPKLSAELRELYQYVQRRTSKGRKDSIAAYIDERLSPRPLTIGGFPAISLAFINPLAFTAFEPDGAVGIVQLPLSAATPRMVLDGLGRIMGVKQSPAALLENFCLAVTIFAPLEGGPLKKEEVAQLFHDFNFRVHPVSKAQAIALDSSDIYISMARQLADTGSLLDRLGGVAKRVAKLGKNNTELVTETNLVRFVRGATEGHKAMTTHADHVAEPNLVRGTFSEMLASLTTFLEGFSTGMGESNFADHKRLHLSGIGWQGLAILHYDIAVRLGLEGGPRARAIQALADVDWTWANPDWVTIGALLQQTDGTLASGPNRRQDIARLYRYLRDKAGITAALEELERRQQAAEAAEEAAGHAEAEAAEADALGLVPEFPTFPAEPAEVA